ncbi:hypothetical protein Efla_003436 [Eimeria flavescens]
MQNREMRVNEGTGRNAIKRDEERKTELEGAFEGVRLSRCWEAKAGQAASEAEREIPKEVSQCMRISSEVQPENDKLPHDRPQSSACKDAEEDYEEAALTAAREIHSFQRLEAVSFAGAGETPEDSGGFCLEREAGDPEEPADDEAEDAFLAAGFLVEGEQQATDPSAASSCQPTEQPDVQIQLPPPPPASVPSDSELAALLDDACCGGGSSVAAAGTEPAAFKTTNTRPFKDSGISSSLLNGSTGLAAQRRAAEAASWCSQQQAAELYCLNEKFLREEAAAGRLRVRQQRNPYGESFKPMRLYAVKEIEQLAVQVWGSLEAAKAEKERRIEERWQRKKKDHLQRSASPPQRKRKSQLACARLAPPSLASAVTPGPRSREEEWEEI